MNNNEFISYLEDDDEPVTKSVGVGTVMFADPRIVTEEDLRSVCEKLGLEADPCPF